MKSAAIYIVETQNSIGFKGRVGFEGRIAPLELLSKRRISYCEKALPNLPNGTAFLDKQNYQLNPGITTRKFKPWTKGSLPLNPMMPENQWTHPSEYPGLLFF